VTTSRRLAFPSALLLLSLPASHCFGFAEIARGALLLQTTAAATYDSYFIGTQTNDSDFYLTLSPMLRYSRSAGLSEIKASAGTSINRYDKNSGLDSEDILANASITLPTVEGARLTGDASIGYSESTVVDLFVNDRVPTKSFTAGFNLDYKLGLKMSVSDSLSYSDTTRDIYSDQETFGNDLSFSYSDFLYDTTLTLSHGYTQTMSSGENYLGADLDQVSNSYSATLSRPLFGSVIGSATYGYRVLTRSAQETTIGQTDDQGSFFSIGIRGPFLPRTRFPKLTSSASLSYQESRSAGINDTGGKTLTGALGLSWAARERTDISIQASRNTELTATDLTAVNTNVSLGVTERIGLATILTGTIGYQWVDFRGIDRSDAILTGRLNASRTLSKHWSLAANYEYTNVKNDQTGFQPGRFSMRDYDRHLVSASVTNTF
jgi:hypothetical protein